MKIRDARSLPSEAQEDIRRKAVKAVLCGKKQVEVAKLFGITRQALGKWVGNYKKRGVKALKARPKGRPVGGSLLPWQAAYMAKLIIDRTPEQLKLPFYLWTREAVAQSIEKKFKIRLSLWTVGRYLNRWGFTPQKPVRRAYEQNPKEIRRWLRHEYPKIYAVAKRERAAIYWGDEMGLRSDHVVGRSYGLSGKTPVIHGTGQRFGCNMISAITNRGSLVFMVFRRRFQDTLFLDFLKRMAKQSKQKVFLIVDRHPVHRSGRVKAWLNKNSHKISLFFLPSYSPELNPDEMLNQDIKSNAVGRQRARTQAELISTVRKHLRSRQRRPQLVKRYFQERHVQYAAA